MMVQGGAISPGPIEAPAGQTYRAELAQKAARYREDREFRERIKARSRKRSREDGAKYRLVDRMFWWWMVREGRAA